MIKHGLFIGKFYPPHHGHHAAIRMAASQCHEVTVLVMSAAVETIPLADRMAWFRAEHAAEPTVRVAGIPCDAPVDVTDPRIWAAQVAAMRAGMRSAGAPADVDAVFSNDDYGSELARWFDAIHVRTARDGFNSTAIRQDLAAHWDWLAPATRAGLTSRVVVLGAESTGTTTISNLLARHYTQRWKSTTLVPEYGRDYTSLKWARQPETPLDELTWTTEDFDVVALRFRTLIQRQSSPFDDLFQVQHRGKFWRDDGIIQQQLDEFLILSNRRVIHRSRLQADRSNRVESEVPHSEVVADSLPKGEKLRIQREGVIVEFGLDERGR